MLMSINPMGVPLLRPPETPDTMPLYVDSNVEGSEESARMKISISHILEQLADYRRIGPTNQNAVGNAIHSASKGAMWGFQEWFNWITYGLPTAQAEALKEEQSRVEMLMQWKSFAIRQQNNSVTGIMRLRSMLRQDSRQDRKRWNAFVEKERTTDNVKLQTPIQAVQQMGTMTHMDIANFLSHELRSSVVCTSNAGRGIWWYYRQRLHRWDIDKDGAHVFMMIRENLQKYVVMLRDQLSLSTAVTAAAAAAAAGSAGSGRPPPRLPPIHRLLNMGSSIADSPELQLEIVIHLDLLSGDVRQLNSIMRSLAVHLYDETFTSDIDSLNEHLIPFTNGVLDLEERRLRPGRPDDMVMRGPMYDWIDYDNCDVHVQELERIITTIFPDRTVRDFFLDVGATFLRRRNRFKHFYILIGCFYIRILER